VNWAVTNVTSYAQKQVHIPKREVRQIQSLRPRSKDQGYGETRITKLAERVGFELPPVLPFQ